MKLRIPTMWLKASRWSERLRPHVLSHRYPTPGLVYDRVEVLPKLVRFADGGYPLILVAESRGYHGLERAIVCAECANACHEWGDETTRIVQCDVNWENPELFCEQCSERIESAYAEPEGAEA